MSIDKEAEDINLRIEYWKELWEDVIDNMESHRHGFKFLNARILLKEILDEIQYNDLKNKENIKYFQRKLKEFLLKDLAIVKFYKEDFNEIRKNFDVNKKLYLKILCEKALIRLNKENYLDKLYDELILVIEGKKWDKEAKEVIFNITQYIICELLIKGYHIKTIKDMLENILDTYQKIEDTLITSFPISTDYLKFKKNGEINFKEYYDAVKNEIDNLTIEKRLYSMRKFFNRNPTEKIFIFRIIGLKGEGDYTFVNINFYSPKIKKIIKNGFYNNNEKDELECFGNKENCFMNAAVRINIVDIREGILQSYEEVEKALDLLMFYYKANSTFEIDKSQHLVVDVNGELISESSSIPDNAFIMKWHSALDLDNNYNSHFINTISRNASFILKDYYEQNELERKIQYSLHWFRKAEQTNNIEDKLLNYWIVIESIICLDIDNINIFFNAKEDTNKFFRVKKVLVSIQKKMLILNNSYMLYKYLYRYCNSIIRGKKKINLPNEIAYKCMLHRNVSGKIDLKDFINNLSELENYISNEVIKEKVQHSNAFYTDNKFAIEELERYGFEVEDDLIQIYRYRNRIVHNAHFDNKTLPFYVEKAKIFAMDLLYKVIGEYELNKNRDINDILLGDYVEITTIVERLNNNNKIVDFL